MQIDIGDLISESMSGIRDALREAYERGYRDGGAAMRDNILRAAGAPEPIKDYGRDVPKALPSEADGKRRAPRGILQETVISVLAMKSDGVPLRDIEDAVLSIAPTVARRSVYGELRRKRGELYELRGDKWYLLRAPKFAAQEEAAGLASKDDPPLISSNQGGQNGTALA